MGRTTQGTRPLQYHCAPCQHFTDSLMLTFLRLEVRVLLELYLIPGLTAFMPWPIGFRWLRFCSRFRFLYGAEWQAALAQARQFVEVGDENLWARQFRLCKLVDHADLYLCMTRSDRWLRRYVDGWDAFPQIEGGAVAVLIHWCPGFWLGRAVRRSGAPGHSVIAAPNRRAVGGSYLAYWYSVLRMWAFERVNGRPAFNPTGVVRRLLKVLREQAGGKVWIGGMLDVPTGPNAPTESVTVFGREGFFPNGLIGVARLAKVPLIMVTCGLDPRTGRRDLVVSGPFDPNTPGLLQHFVDIWQARVGDRSWGYFLWLVMPVWLR